MSYYRSPRTTQERRANQNNSLVRGKRHACNLPSLYDDVRRTFQRTWKKHRKHQYHPIDINE